VSGLPEGARWEFFGRLKYILGEKRWRQFVEMVESGEIEKYLQRFREMLTTDELEQFVKQYEFKRVSGISNRN
jgi:hypothetical protein